MAISLDTAVNSFNDRYIDALHQSQFSRQPAGEMLQQRFASILFEPKMLYIVIGTDSGLLSQYVLSATKPENTRYIFIEFPEIIDTLALEAQPDAQVRIVSPDALDDVLSDFSFNEYAFLGRVVIRHSLAASADYQKIYGPLIWDIEQKITHLFWSQAYSMGLKSFLQMQLINVPDYQLSSGLLSGRYQDKTALILAAGPSLNEHFDWIRENRERLVILAVSRIGKILLKENIKPDFFVHVDPQSIAFDVSKDALQLSGEVPLIAANYAQPLIVSQWRSSVFISESRLPWESELNEPTLPAVGPTVTNTALSSAISMGFSRVLFAGLDLCFDQAGFSHAQGTTEASSGPSMRMDTRRIRTNNGLEAETSPDYFAAIESLEQQATLADAQGIQLVNLSGSAAKIQGIEFIPAAQITFADTGVKPSIPGHVSEEERLAYLASLESELLDAKRQFQSALDAAEEATNLSQRLLNGKGEIDSRTQAKLNALESKIESLSPSMMRFCKVFSLGEFLSDISHKDADKWSENDLLAFGKHYFGTFYQALSEIVSLIDFAIDKTLRRHEELSATPDLDRLYKGWTIDQTFLRAIDWFDHHDQYLDQPKLKTVYDQMLLAYEKLEHDAQEKDEARCNHMASPSLMITKATWLFQNERIEELKDMLTFLGANTRRDFLPSHSALVRGYIAELEGKNQEALAEHQLIIEEGA
ncbi:MAG: DUF115 domain-containing protein, partial [Oceanospirillales bacterium]|nr:DUF115 domain-containing protein [Oceanospirillales bacterium]